MAFVRGKTNAGEVIDTNDGVTNGDDTIIGNAGKDWIYAGGGADFIKGGGGADYIDGGAGRDAVSYEDSSVGVTVNLQTGKGQGGTAEGDTLVDIEDVWGSNHSDVIVGDTGDNTLHGLAGNDILKGGGGADTLDGGEGDDTLHIDSWNDVATGGEGIDTVVLEWSGRGVAVDLASGAVAPNRFGNAYYGEGYYGPDDVPGYLHQLHDIENATGSLYSDRLYGSDGANVLNGNGGNDLLVGRGGNDVLIGGSGDDKLVGGLGADQMSGGSGADTFIFEDFADSTKTGGKPQDLILDFALGVDKLDLSRMDFDAADLLVLCGQSVDGQSAAFVGIDADHDGSLDQGEFVVAVLMAPGSVFLSGDIIV